MAENCCVTPAAMLGDAGVTAIDVMEALLLKTPPPQPVLSASTVSRKNKRKLSQRANLEIRSFIGGNAPRKSCESVKEGFRSESPCI